MYDGPKSCCASSPLPELVGVVDRVTRLVPQDLQAPFLACRPPPRASGCVRVSRDAGARGRTGSPRLARRRVKTIRPRARSGARTRGRATGAHAGARRYALRAGCPRSSPRAGRSGDPAAGRQARPPIRLPGPRPSARMGGACLPGASRFRSILRYGRGVAFQSLSLTELNGASWCGIPHRLVHRTAGAGRVFRVCSRLLQVRPPTIASVSIILSLKPPGVADQGARI